MLESRAEVGNLDNHNESEMKSVKERVLFTTIVTVVLYLILFLFFDKSIDLWMLHNLSGTTVESVGRQISLLASSSCVNLALLCGFGYIIIADPGIRKKSTKRLLYIVITVSIAIIIGEGFKYLFGRYRPIMLFEKGEYGLHFFSTKWEINSTPSDHTIRAFSFFTALSFLFRQYAFLLLLFALIIGASRVVVTAHYPSDVLFGAFVGIMTAIWMYNFFQKFEK